MKPEVGSNLLYHACLILSVQRDEDSPIQVLDSIGFYGITPCSDKNIYIRNFKKKYGIDIDLTGGYGRLMHEEMRYLDKGEGLTGITFHISAHRFSTLRQSIKEDMEQQEIAIKEATQSLIQDNLNNSLKRDQANCELAANDQPISEDKINEYISKQTNANITPHEIYSKELERAAREKSQPRLKPFEFRMSYTPLTFFTLADSHTCKNGAFEILQRAQIPLSWQFELGLKQTSTSSIPRFSGSANAEELHLFSQGTYSTFVSKSSGLTQKTRNWQPQLDSNHPDKTTLYWSIPPDMIVEDQTNQSQSKKLIETYKIDSNIRKKMSNFMLRLQKTQNLLIQSHTANKHSHFDFLIKKLDELIKSFSIPKKNKDTNYINSLLETGNTLLENIYHASTLKEYTSNTITLTDDATNEKKKLTLELSNLDTKKLEKIQSKFLNNEQEIQPSLFSSLFKL